jgi:hypothetical protein
MVDQRGAPRDQLTAVEAVTVIKVNDTRRNQRTTSRITLGSIRLGLLDP